VALAAKNQNRNERKEDAKFTKGSLIKWNFKMTQDQNVVLCPVLQIFENQHCKVSVKLE
jgi:hypothetical protein